MTDPLAALVPGATLGMLGGGQLGRMFCQVAHRMGYAVTVLDPDPDSPAGRLATRHLRAAYDDAEALRELAATCDAVTTEFENVPAATLARLRTGTRVHPAPPAVAAAQNRNREKDYARRAGLEPVASRAVASVADIPAAVAATGLPAILKTATLGYDGKGQAAVETEQGAIEAFEAFGGVECVLEQRVDLAAELSVIIARNEHGAHAVYPVAQNAHRGGILHMTSVPAQVDSTLQEKARGWRMPWTMSVCWPSSSSSIRRDGCISTRWRRGPTTAAISPWTPVSAASSSSSCARSAACRRAARDCLPRLSW